MKDAKGIYERRARRYEAWGSRLEKDIKKISYLRLIVGLAMVSSWFYGYGMKSKGVAWGVTASSLLLFAALVLFHHRLKRKKAYLSVLWEINSQSLDRIQGLWKNFEDRGEEFREERHPFSADLDLFGQGSVFQWINSANTAFGRIKLAEMLTKGCGTEGDILQKQKAIKELAEKRWWRQRLQGEGMISYEKNGEQEGLLIWCRKINPLYEKGWFILTIYGLPIVTVGTALFSYGLQIVPKSIPLLLILVHCMIIFTGIGKRNRELDRIYQYKNRLRVYRKMLAHIEKTSFKEPYLQNLQRVLKNQRGDSAIQQLNQLEKLVDRILNRNNMLFFPVNILFLWDYQCLIGIHRWKRQSGGLMNKWLETIGELEGLASLALIAYDYPDWYMPSIVHGSSTLAAKSMGHPLLGNEQVRNDLTIQEPHRVLLITGSNMSGKSTLLRTAGMNLVLAYAGAPVCATYFRCAKMDIYTCMRVSDNLEKSISSFYGELLRIKEIVEASRRGRPVFFLLDEIFKGTNSHDRHLGAKILIKQLYRQHAIGMVSTHDLELGELEGESKGSVKNYHFQEHYQEQEIRFDYRLRPGISTTRNALYLIKMIGVNIEE